MRRWRVVVVDDNPQGSLEAVLLSPLVLPYALGADASAAVKERALRDHPLNFFLPLADGEMYAAMGDIEFQTLDFEGRRRSCAPRRPMIEVERDFARAWKLVDDMAADPPDIVFLDVLFESKDTAPAAVDAIIREIEDAKHLGGRSRLTMREVLARGGLYLLGKLLRGRGHVTRMPLVVLYSASRDVQLDFRPFEYASDGKYEVVVKDILRNMPQNRRDVFRRRVHDYLLEGLVRADDVREAVSLLSTPAAIAGDHETIQCAFRRDIGDGWLFATMFVGEAIAYRRAEPERRAAVVEELQEFIAPFVSQARSLVGLMSDSPLRLFTHQTGFVSVDKRPAWLPETIDVETSEQGRVGIPVDARGEADVQAALDESFQRLPASLLGLLAQRFYSDESSDDETLASRATRLKQFDRYIHGLRSYDTKLQKFVDSCRMSLPASSIAQFLCCETENGPLQVVLPFHDFVDARTWDRTNALELMLAPSNGLVKEPLATLLRAILTSMHDRGYRSRGGAGKVFVTFEVHSKPAIFQVNVSDEGDGFEALEYFDAAVWKGDLSNALVAAAPWFDVEVHSRGVRCRPAVRARKAEESAITTGTMFAIRIPAHAHNGIEEA